LITLLSAFVVDLVSPIGSKKTQVMIISKKYRELREMILNKMNRGVTMLYGKTGFLQEKTFVLLTVISNRDVVRLRNEVEKLDPEAFFMVSVISEVRGRGFSSDKIALPKAAEGMDLEEASEEELSAPPAKTERE
ncbi:MAG: YitT family protein, partial [Clostridia bacterium]|nr:YitT family protein [Clostridia bacterium]